MLSFAEACSDTRQKFRHKPEKYFDPVTAVKNFGICLFLLQIMQEITLLSVVSKTNGIMQGKGSKKVC